MSYAYTVDSRSYSNKESSGENEAHLNAQVETFMFMVRSLTRLSLVLVPGGSIFSLTSCDCIVMEGNDSVSCYIIATTSDSIIVGQL